jgi:hypothetical protein
MSKEKNKNTFRVAALLLVACLISSVMLSGTFAKYTSEYAGKDTALVARWNLTSNTVAEATAADISLPIWDHGYASNIYATDGTNYLIAPGIEGSFVVDFTYDADVDAELIFNFTKSGNYDSDDAGADANEAVPVPIQYSIDGFNTIYYDLDDLEDAIIGTATTDSTSTITGAGGTYIITDTATAFDEDPTGPISINQTVSWRWPYNVSQHNGVTATDEGVAADRTDAGFTGTGAFITFEEAPTAFKAWTDDDDTAIGNISKTLDRGSYVLNLAISATQKVPE